jgi:calcineurin-like phosphoesterase
MTEAVLKRLLAAGADLVTSGNHVWEKRDFWPLLDTESRVLRPANYPAGTPGRGWARVEKTGAGGKPIFWLVINLQGREYMTPIDCPFRCFDSLVNTQEPSAGTTPSVPASGEDLSGPLKKDGDLVLVDFHAESAREKEALAYYLDGRASLVAGTHTHVQTADERILPEGTGYITDLGMTGVTESVIGMDQNICLNRARNQVLYRMECAAGEGRKAVVQGILAEIDGETGKTVFIDRISCS